MLVSVAMCCQNVVQAAPNTKKQDKDKKSIHAVVKVAEEKVPELQAAADNGDTVAMRKLGHYYMQQAEDAKGCAYFLKAAEAGDAEARAWYAQALYRQRGFSQEGEKLALEQAKIAAESGNAMGLYFCALFGYEDKEYASACLDEAAKKGFAPAMRAYAHVLQSKATRGPERERKKFLAWYDKAMKAGDLMAALRGIGKRGYIFERYPYPKSAGIIRKVIATAKKRPLCWYDTCFDYDFPMADFAHGSARYGLVIQGHIAMEQAASSEKNKMDICTKSRKELYSYLEEQAAKGDPAACHAIISLIKMPHLFWSCRPDASFSNSDADYWKNKAEELKKTSPPLYRKLRYPSAK